jgi:hypothetical protein
MRHRLPALFSPSFALISVLALVSLASLTATAFLASARLDRQANRSLGESARLEMACASAMNCAKFTLNQFCEDSWTPVATYWRGTNATDWTNETGYLLFGVPRAGQVRWVYHCGFNPAIHKKIDSTPFDIKGTNTNPGSYLTQIGTFMAAMTNNFVTNPPSTDTNCTLIPLLGGRTSPPVGWTYIYQDKKIANSTNTTNVPVARFSYYMEDLSGLIDAERMGGTTRSNGIDASEITLTNLTTNWSSNSIINPTNITQFTNSTNRARYFSPGLILYANTNLSTNDLRYFAHGLLSWNNFPNVIPVGIPITNTLGYAQGGNLKLNLNSATIDTIAGTITNNLPNFTNRAGGMSGLTYVSNIAANIVDLFDTDNFATTVGNSVRGVDSYPFINEIWDRFLLQGVTVNTNNPTNWVVTYNLEITTWMELWNLSSQPITNGSMSIFYRNREILTNRLGTALDNNIPVSFTNRLNYTTNLSWNFTTNFLPTNPILSDLTNSRISPNSFHMVSFSPFTVNVSTNLKIPAGTDPKKTNLVLLWATNGNLNGYATYFSSNSAALPSSMLTNPSRVDSSSSAFNGIQRNTNEPTKHFLDSSQTVWWRGNATPNSDLTLGLTGDPRIMFHLNATAGQTWFDHQFESGRASWWARNTLSGLSYSVNLTKWPETSHNTTEYANITDPSTNPVKTGITRPQETNKPVQIIYNTPPTNIAQLGQTFDPMQWSYNINNNRSGVPLTGATATSSSGGGHTLRIGRAEHPRFAFTNMGGTFPVPNMGVSAAALLDIFSVSNSYDNGGKINLNTAPAPVLRALAGGVTLNSDSSMMPSSTLAVPNTMTEAFVQGVMRYRAIYPFLSPSQLAFIATDYGITNTPSTSWTNTWPTNAVFGNTNSSIALSTTAPGNSLGSTASMGVSAWNDQAAEEWFSKIYRLTSVGSCNFRTYVVAQLLDTNGLPSGRSTRKYYLMHIRYADPGSSSTPALDAGPFISFESPY